jgi:hypothetical protein
MPTTAHIVAIAARSSVGIHNAPPYTRIKTRNTPANAERYHIIANCSNGLPSLQPKSQSDIGLAARCEKFSTVPVSFLKFR